MAPSHVPPADASPGPTRGGPSPAVPIALGLALAAAYLATAAVLVRSADEVLRARWPLLAMVAVLAMTGLAAASWWRWRAARRERERAELLDRSAAALRESEARFRAAFEDSSLGMALFDPEGRVIETNAAMRRIVSADTDAELRGRSALEFVYDAEQVPVIAADLERFATATAPIEHTLRLRRQDGSFAHVRTRANTLRDANGVHRLTLILVEDLTDRIELEAQLQLADRMASIGTLAAGVAHEINNPLAFVLANLEFAVEALRKAGAEPEVVRALQEAHEGGRRVRAIVRDLRTFSRADDARRERVDVRRVAEAAIGLAGNEIRQRARLEVRLDEAPPVRASEHRLGQVFLNLLVNAAQAIPEGRPAAHVLAIRTGTAPDGRALVEVRDTGVGISPDVLPRIFDPFFTTKPVGIGTGLGLSICHGIVTALGGEIRVESAPGKGTAFTVLLPPSDAAPETPEDRREPAATPGRRARVLVVDDEPLVTRAIERALARHEVVSRTSGREALDVLAAGADAFDVVVCDLMMPEMTGMELHERVRGAAPALAERFVFLTGGAFTEAARAFLAGVENARLEKPFDPAALREVVGRLVDGRPP